MIRVLFVALFSLVALSLSAQDSTVVKGKKSKNVENTLEIFPEARKPKKKGKTSGIQLNKEFSVGGKITTTGWSFFAESTRYINLDRKRVLQFEFMELKHPKQIKQTNELTLSPFGFNSPKSFVYGKQNNLYALHAGWGSRYVLGDKAKKSGVEVNFTWVAGPSLGILKPYYLNIIETNDNRPFISAERYDPDIPERFLNSNSIYGSSGFSYGLGQISLVPGAYGKAGINFDWASYSEFVKSLEAGIGADVFPRRVPILITDDPDSTADDVYALEGKNKPFFVYLYLSLQLGKKW